VRVQCHAIGTSVALVPEVETLPSGPKARGSVPEFELDLSVGRVSGVFHDHSKNQSPGDMIRRSSVLREEM